MRQREVALSRSKHSFITRCVAGLNRVAASGAPTKCKRTQTTSLFCCHICCCCIWFRCTRSTNCSALLLSARKHAELWNIVCDVINNFRHSIALPLLPNCVRCNACHPYCCRVGYKSNEFYCSGVALAAAATNDAICAVSVLGCCGHCCWLRRYYLLSRMLVLLLLLLLLCPNRHTMCCC